MNNCVIFDIDGTIVKTTHLLTEADKMGLVGQQKWEYFYTYCNNKCIEPIYPIVEMCKMYKNKGYQVFFVTGRNFADFENTSFLLMRIFDIDKEHNQWWQTIMRGKHDYRDAHLVKQDILNLIQKEYKINLFVDDEEENIKMACGMGICSLLVKNVF